MEPYFVDIWKAVLQGLDDMRESVRAATVRALSSVMAMTGRFVDPRHARSAAEAVAALECVVALLLEHGLSSSAKDIQLRSVGLFKELVTAADANIVSFAAAILEKLLHCSSALEPEMISYLSVQAQVDADTLHAARATMARMTPLGETVDLLLKWCVESNILPMVASIESGLRGTGLPTLLQSAWAVVALSRTTAAVDFLPGKPATRLVLGLLDAMGRHASSTAAFKELSTATASVASFASNKLWDKRIVPLVVDTYLGSGDDASLRFNSGFLLSALTNNNRSIEVVRGRVKDLIGVLWIGRRALGGCGGVGSCTLDSVFFWQTTRKSAFAPSLERRTLLWTHRFCCTKRTCCASSTALSVPRARGPFVASASARWERCWRKPVMRYQSMRCALHWPSCYRKRRAPSTGKAKALAYPLWPQPLCL